MQTAVEALSDPLNGQDPRRIEDLWQLMTKVASCRAARFSPAPSQISTRGCGTFWASLWASPYTSCSGGAVRERVLRAGVGGDSPSAVAEAAAGQTQGGMTVVKMKVAGRLSLMPTVQEVGAAVFWVESVREVIGDENEVAVDFHGRTSIAAARQLGQLLAPVRPLSIEEPVLPEHLGQIGEAVASTTTPVACGTRLYSGAEFLPVLQRGVAVVRPGLPARRHARCHPPGRILIV